MAKSDETSKYEFNLELSGTVRSLSFYHIDENGEKQLKFDPPVYQARYSAINCILTMKEWIPHIKKVLERILKIHVNGHYDVLFCFLFHGKHFIDSLIR